MKIKLPYGDTELAVEVPDHARVLVLPQAGSCIPCVKAEQDQIL